MNSVFGYLRTWQRYRQSLRELKRLNDRELADIGVSRSDIQRISWEAAGAEPVAGIA